MAPWDAGLTRTQMAAVVLASVQVDRCDESDLVDALVPLIRTLTEGRGRIIEACVDAMSAGGEHLFAAGPWVACAERMPSEGSDACLWLHRNGDIVLAFVLTTKGVTRIYGPIDTFDVTDITHWAPIYAPVVAPASKVDT